MPSESGKQPADLRPNDYLKVDIGGGMAFQPLVVVRPMLRLLGLSFSECPPEKHLGYVSVARVTTSGLFWKARISFLRQQ